MKIMNRSKDGPKTASKTLIQPTINLLKKVNGIDFKDNKETAICLSKNAKNRRSASNQPVNTPLSNESSYMYSYYHT